MEAHSTSWVACCPSIDSSSAAVQSKSGGLGRKTSWIAHPGARSRRHAFPPLVTFYDFKKTHTQPPMGFWFVCFFFLQCSRKVHPRLLLLAVPPLVGHGMDRVPFQSSSMAAYGAHGWAHSFEGDHSTTIFSHFFHGHCTHALGALCFCRCAGMSRQAPWPPPTRTPPPWTSMDGMSGCPGFTTGARRARARGQALSPHETSARHFQSGWRVIHGNVPNAP